MGNKTITEQRIDKVVIKLKKYSKIISKSCSTSIPSLRLVFEYDEDGVSYIQVKTSNVYCKYGIVLIGENHLGSFYNVKAHDDYKKSFKVLMIRLNKIIEEAKNAE